MLSIVARYLATSSFAGSGVTWVGNLISGEEWICDKAVVFPVRHDDSLKLVLGNKINGT